MSRYCRPRVYLTYQNGRISDKGTGKTGGEGRGGECPKRYFFFFFFSKYPSKKKLIFMKKVKKGPCL